MKKCRLDAGTEVWSFLLAIAALAGFAGCDLASRPQRTSKCVNSVPHSYVLLGEFTPTFYRILDEGAKEWRKEYRTEPLRTHDGKVIARVAPSFKRQLDMEGSARLRDGRVVNLDEKVHGDRRYLVVRNAPFGLGALGYKLIPYRTVAVDPKVIKLGTVLYIPSLVGVRLPSGEVHDGFAFACDAGQGIVSHRIDLFVGFESDLSNALTRSGGVRKGFRHNELMCVYRVDEATAARLTKRFQGAEDRH